MTNPIFRSNHFFRCEKWEADIQETPEVGGGQAAMLADRPLDLEILHPLLVTEHQRYSFAALVFALTTSSVAPVLPPTAAS